MTGSIGQSVRGLNASPIGFACRLPYRGRMGEAAPRLAGIMAADVVGYSAAVAADETTGLARVRTLRTDIIEPLATAHGGRLFKTTGDGFLAAFASAVQALRCAIAIQERLRAQPDGLRLRIGVHQGEVVPEHDDLFGDGVIIAARLEPLAEPGGICISARVREDAAGKVALDVQDRHAGAEEYRDPDSRVSHTTRPRSGFSRRPAFPARHALDRRAAVRQYQWRPRPGVFR
jgi:class 3 adenylate cyclase